MLGRFRMTPTSPALALSLEAMMNTTSCRGENERHSALTTRIRSFPQQVNIVLKLKLDRSAR